MPHVEHLVDKHVEVYAGGRVTLGVHARVRVGRHRQERVVVIDPLDIQTGKDGNLQNFNNDSSTVPTNVQLASVL